MIFVISCYRGSERVYILALAAVAGISIMRNMRKCKSRYSHTTVRSSLYRAEDRRWKKQDQDVLIEMIKLSLYMVAFVDISSLLSRTIQLLVYYIN